MHIDPQIITKYRNRAESIKRAVRHNILPEAYNDLSTKWAYEVGKHEKSFEARSKIDKTCKEAEIRRLQEQRSRRNGVVEAYRV